MCSVQILGMLVFLFTFVVPLNYALIVFWSDYYGTGRSIKRSEEFSETHCESVPETDFKVKSVSTDSCIQFYSSKCFGNAVIINSTTKDLPFYASIKYWAPCSFGQPVLNVYIYNNSGLDYEPVAKFVNLCKCVNIPQRLDNHGVYVYTEGQQIVTYLNENCTGSFLYIDGGKILGKSFEPFGHPHNCPRLNGILTDISAFTRTHKQDFHLQDCKGEQSS